MPHSLDIVLTDFKNDLERVDSLLNLTKLFRDFGASEAPSPSGNDEHSTDSCGRQPVAIPVWAEALALHTESKARRTDLPIFSGSLLLYITGRFEYCMKQVVEAIADDISSRTDKYENLPQQIQRSLKYKTLEVAQNPKKFGYSDAMADSLLESLVLNSRGSSQSFSIKSEVLSITGSNMRPELLQELLKTLGLTDFWRDVGKQASVKLFLQKSVDQEASSAAQAKLSEIMEERNQIAHPTSTTSFPDADKVLKSSEFLRILASNAVDIAKVYLTGYQGSMAISA
ncbi:MULTISPECIES: HEPN domain-containing protein [unclassified Mesorhizobium]|uniref:HEPN domain-containing protein n=1 Tax=unclassified Mesorhizobium TaxID=325217 RepID=UPI000FCAC6E8|nr:MULTISPECIES: HEPN domain-containing protein [unclassified Mesorhizobium]RUV44627.1 hypothetical protein EOD29_07635 [Mesorhizobium sp. M1A.T.Ca.IN.004.03.1.1]RWK27842.1 MAG: hypothetical protein EOR40_29170 [Mesorhizobium sp.]RWK86777.1 MAG: hypothetical protein EOR52_20850 [Mesorhizobium sp.]TIP21610.1 MAG: hypothetical protein E5X66_02310 [Mesorhizobium sp.]TJV86879.1 MAG: hypothetical protein E5X45_01080 [Mesorhizobium sp.]